MEILTIEEFAKKEQLKIIRELALKFIDLYYPREEKESKKAYRKRKNLFVRNCTDSEDFLNFCSNNKKYKAFFLMSLSAMKKSGIDIKYIKKRLLQKRRKYRPMRSRVHIWAKCFHTFASIQISLKLQKLS